MLWWSQATEPGYPIKLSKEIFSWKLAKQLFCSYEREEIECTTANAMSAVLPGCLANAMDLAKL